MTELAFWTTHAGLVREGVSEIDPITLAELREYARIGASVGVPRFVLGSFTGPYAMMHVLAEVPWVRRFKLAEHFNVTILDGVARDDGRGSSTVVYVGHKSDGSYDRQTLELMLRCESREFGSLADDARRLVLSRLRCCDRRSFEEAHARLTRSHARRLRQRRAWRAVERLVSGRPSRP